MLPLKRICSSSETAAYFDMEVLFHIFIILVYCLHHPWNLNAIWERYYLGWILVVPLTNNYVVDSILLVQAIPMSMVQGTSSLMCRHNISTILDLASKVRAILIALRRCRCFRATISAIGVIVRACLSAPAYSNAVRHSLVHWNSVKENRAVISSMFHDRSYWIHLYNWEMLKHRFLSLRLIGRAHYLLNLLKKVIWFS